MEQRVVGFVGLGNMGGRIARRLIDSGVRVIGYDRDTEQARAAGVEVAASPAQVARQVDVVLLSLPDSTVVEAVVTGPDGILGEARAGLVVVDLSTAAPRSTVALHAALAERGAELVDAGISGGASAAAAGTMSIMAGGSERVVGDLQWVLDVISAQVFYMGPSGSGHTAKLLNNFLNAVSLAATAEVMVAARKADLDLETFLDVLNASSGVNFATLKRFPSIIHGDYLEGGLSNRLMMKDVVLYTDHLRQLGVPGINAAGPMASFGLALQLGYGDQISNRVVDAIGDLAGGVRLHDDQGREACEEGQL
jgi:3-hydroxyisobutyrate dehydrogenase